MDSSIHVPFAMLETDRLFIRKLKNEDADFIFHLVNTPGWLKFIGDRNVQNIDDSMSFIKQAITTPGKDYFPIILKADEVPIGILSFMQRETLEYPDFGFALLPEYYQKGYCFEASYTLLNELLSHHSSILAVTKYNNLKTIRLLVKLGFQFQKQTENGELLNHYLIRNK